MPEVEVVAPELGRVTVRRPPFKYSALTRVWFSDTDAQGVVYYGRYLPYFDHARTEYHRHLGAPATHGRELVMRASAVEYHAPARFDDLIEAFVRHNLSVLDALMVIDHGSFDGTSDILAALVAEGLPLSASGRASRARPGCRRARAR